MVPRSLAQTSRVDRQPVSGTHSVFAPSKASVWGNCFGAIALLLAAKLPDEAPNIHAASGTLTHKIAEEILGNGTAGPYYEGTKHTVEGFEFTIDSERIDRAVKYVEAVLARGGVQFYEQKMASLPWPGTGDAVIARLEEHALEAHDLKDGNGIIYAKDNEQLICYLLLAWKEFDYLDDFQIFRGFIHQPKKGHTDWVEYTKAEMLEWLDKLTRAYRRGSDLIGETPNKIKAALTAGPHCEKGWCRMRGNCPVRNASMTAQIPDLTVIPARVTDDQIGELLSRRARVEAWFNDLFAEALNRAKIAGVSTVPGFKLATGKQGPRKWVDETTAGDAMYDVLLADAYERSLISPTTAERKLKKTHPELWSQLQSNISRSEGQTTLVPDADPRAPVRLDLPEFENVTGSDLL